MFEIAWSELFLVVIVAIIVVGPKELPGMLRALGRMLGKLRRSADDFRRQFEDSMRDAGGEDLQRELNALRQNNPLNQIRESIESAARDAEASARTATEPPRLPTPETFIDKPEEPPGGSVPAVEPEQAAVSSPAPPPADAAPAAPPAPATPEPSAPAKEPKPASQGHEPLANGQHRSLS